MSAPELTIIAEGSFADVFAQVRDRINAQRSGGTMSEAEAVGARWAIDTAEAIAPPEPGHCRFSDDIHDLTIGSARGG